ncbi:MAG: hypothetical protein IPH77_06260 [Ignavibacteria bacterium]|nr:hypothetical protein [Ignavibacteria bacterium]
MLTKSEPEHAKLLKLAQEDVWKDGKYYKHLSEVNMNEDTSKTESHN